MSVRRELLLPILTGVIAIMLERWLFHRSPALRSLIGTEPVR